MATLLFSSAFLKSYSDLAATNSERAGKVFEALRKLEQEQYDGGLRVKKIKGVAVWEARFDDAGRLLFVYDRGHVRRNEAIAAEKVIRIGYMLCDHDKVINTARRGYAGWLSAELEDTDGWKDWFETRLPANPIALTQIETVAKELPDEDFWNVYWNFAADCEATPDNNREGSLWYLTEVDALNGGTAAKTPRELLLVPQQYEALNAHLPLLLRGSAGSGKTTVALYKMRDIADTDPDSTMAYVSYNAALVRKAEEWFRLLPRRELKLENIHFLTYETLLQQWLEEGETQTNRRVANYADFLTFYRKQQGSKQAALAWSEIRSVIKGSFADTQVPQKSQDVAAALTEKQYVNLPARWSALQPDQRKSVFKVFEGYEKFLKAEGLEDEQDTATRALRLVLTGKTKLYDRLFLDETQDLTEKQLNVLMRLVNRESGLLLAGDPTQMLQPTGAAWRFVTGHYYERNLPQPNAHNLERNFRCTAPVVRLSAAILARLRAVGVSDLEWPREGSQIEGRVPILTPPTSEVLADMRTLSPNRVILVADNDVKTRLEAETENIVFTVSEAKGMEWEHVFLYELDAKLRPLDSIHQREQRAAVQQEQQNALRHLYVAVTRALDTITIVAEPNKHSLWSHPDVQQCLAIVNASADVVPVAVPAQTTPHATPQTAANPASAVKPSTLTGKTTPTAKLAQPVHTASPTRQSNTPTIPQSAYKPLPYTPPTPEEWLEKGHYYRDHEQWNAALKCYQQAGSETWGKAVRAIVAFYAKDSEGSERLMNSLKEKHDQEFQFTYQMIGLRLPTKKPVEVLPSKRIRKEPTAVTTTGGGIDILSMLDETGLFRAVKNNDIVEVIRLLNSGVDVDTRGHIGVTPLMSAVADKNMEVAVLLVERGAEVNAKEPNGYFPLMWIAERDEDVALAKLLIQRGANVNAQTLSGLTCLMVAACRSIEMARLFLANDSDVRLRDNKGMTARDYAKQAKRLDIVQVFDEHAKTYLPNSPAQSSTNLLTRKQMFDKAVTLKRAGRYKQAIEIYEQIITLDRRNETAYKSLAKVYYLMDESLATLRNYIIAVHLEAQSLRNRLRLDTSQAKDMFDLLRHHSSQVVMQAKAVHPDAWLTIVDPNMPRHIGYALLHSEADVKCRTYRDTVRGRTSSPGQDALTVLRTEKKYIEAGQNYILENFKWEEFDHNDPASLY